jgi:Flp pilus assembly pilin Flp
MSGGLTNVLRRHAEGRLRERGALAVEFALVAPLVIMLLIGTVTTGVSYSHTLGVTNAVREGARFGAIADASSASWGSDVADRVHQTQFDDPGATTSICVELWRGPGAGTLVETHCEPAGGPGVDAADLDVYKVPPTLPSGTCAVRVVATKVFTISAPPLFAGVPRKMTRGSVARYERDGC